MALDEEFAANPVVGTLIVVGRLCIFKAGNGPIEIMLLQLIGWCALQVAWYELALPPRNCITTIRNADATLSKQVVSLAGITSNYYDKPHGATTGL